MLCMLPAQSLEQARRQFYIGDLREGCEEVGLDSVQRDAEKQASVAGTQYSTSVVEFLAASRRAGALHDDAHQQLPRLLMHYGIASGEGGSAAPLFAATTAEDGPKTPHEQGVRGCSEEIAVQDDATSSVTAAVAKLVSNTGEGTAKQRATTRSYVFGDRCRVPLLPPGSPPALGEHGCAKKQ